MTREVTIDGERYIGCEPMWLEFTNHNGHHDVAHAIVNHRGQRVTATLDHDDRGPFLRPITQAEFDSM